jgi:glycosyltransferase involved in cell wall biosynthesis
MKIAIDIRPLGRFDNRFRGIGCYIYNLVEGILAGDIKNEYVLLTSSGDGSDKTAEWLDSLRGKFEGRVGAKALPPSDSLNIRNQLALYKLIVSEKIDVFHSPTQTGCPWFKPCKTIVTIHDLVQLVFPKEYYGGIRHNIKFQAKIKAASRAAKIIAVSENTKKDIIKLLGVPDSRVEVVHNGVSENFRPIKDEAVLNRVKDKYARGNRFVMYVGGFEERKNIERILKAFQHVKEKEEGVSLLMAGKPDAEGEKLIAGIADKTLFKDVIFTGFVVEEELVSLYNACEFLLLPSLYEGFGLPVVEAMACSKAVVVSKNSSLAEVAGDCGYYVDPYNEIEIASAVSTLLRDNALRSSLENRALDRVKEFSWKKAARDTVRIYEDC